MESLKVFIAGHTGMVGSSIIHNLEAQNDIPGLKILKAHRSKLNLEDFLSVKEFLASNIPNQIYLCAAKVGGIGANSAYLGDFIHKNLLIQNNIISIAFDLNIKKLLFLGSSCIYPRDCKQPISESSLMSGFLEKTNEPYAVAKIAGLKQCEFLSKQYFDLMGTDYRSIMPTNLYGPGDNFHIYNSHVIPALIRKIHNAHIVDKLKSVTLWGSGTPLREFLYVDDLAKASIHVMNLPRKDYLNCSSEHHINVGSGEEISIRELASLISEIIGYKGKIIFDSSMPDGTPRKVLDSSSILSTGWKPSVDIYDGLVKTYEYFTNNYQYLRGINNG